MKFKIAIPLFKIKIPILEVEYDLIDLYIYLKYSELDTFTQTEGTVVPVHMKHSVFSYMYIVKLYMKWRQKKKSIFAVFKSF